MHKPTCFLTTAGAINDARRARELAGTGKSAGQSDGEARERSRERGSGSFKPSAPVHQMGQRDRRNLPFAVASTSAGVACWH